MTIETKVQAQSSSLSTYAASLDSLRGKVDGWVSSAVSYRSSIQDAWDGAAATACDSKAGQINTNLREVAEQLQTYKTAVTSLKDQISSVEQSMNSIRSEASGAGLTVRGTIIEPPPTVISSDPAVIAEAQRKVAAYMSLAAQASTARGVESAAHTAFGATCSQISTNPAWNNFREILATVTGAKDGSGKILDAAENALTIGGGLILGSRGRFALRGPDGRFAKFPKTIKELTEAAKNAKNWQNVKNAGDSARKAVELGKKALGTAEKIGKVTKVLGYAGIALDGANGAVEQWTADSQDPSLGTGEKVVRATANAAWEAGVGWAGTAAGAKVGATVGAAIGSAVPIVGTAAGAVIGGVVGGIAGGAVGDWIKNAAGDFVKGAIDMIRW